MFTQQLSKAGHNVSRSTTSQDILARLKDIDDASIMQDSTGLPQDFVCPKEPIACKISLIDGVPTTIDIELAKKKKTDKDRVLLLLEVEVIHAGETFCVGVKSSKVQIAAILQELESNSNFSIPCKFTRSTKKFDSDGNEVSLDNPSGYFRFYGKNLQKVVATNTQPTETKAAEQTVI